MGYCSQVALAVANGRLYAVGGYRGSTHLDTVEVFDPEANQWIIHSRMKTTKSAGVGVLRMSQQSHQ
ncbi:kelch repeat protein [Ostertagia ostertagi]